MITGLLVWTLACFFQPAFEFLTFSPALDQAFDAMGLFATVAVAGLAWVRYRENGAMFSLFEASAFLVLAVPNAVHLEFFLVGPGSTPGASLLDQSQAQLYAFPVSLIMAACLLALGSVVYGPNRRPRSPMAVVLVPASLLLALTAVLRQADPLVPRLASTATVAGSRVAGPAPTPLAILLGGIAGVLFAIGAVLTRRDVRASGSVGGAILTVGLVVATFAQVDAIADPAFAGLVSGADLLRISFYVILALALVVEIHGTMRALAIANDDLARLTDVEVERAALEERGRMSRELHDGLAQELWFAKLKAGRLATLPSLDPEAHTLVAELAFAIDASLAESRQAVMALRTGADPRTSFHELLGRCVDEFEDRYGVPAERSFEADVSAVSARGRAELLRVAQEALSNVGQHAGATHVIVQTTSTAGAIRLTIRDDGSGFDPGADRPHRFGLTGMRERASLLGGNLMIRSKPRGGTLIALTVPATSID